MIHFRKMCDQFIIIFNRLTALIYIYIYIYIHIHIYTYNIILFIYFLKEAKVTGKLKYFCLIVDCGP